MLERPGLLDHPELDGAGVGFDRDPAGLEQDDHEQRRGGQQVRRPDDLIRSAANRGAQHIRQVGGGDQRDREHHQQHHRFGDRGERLGPAGPELRVHPAGFRGRHRDQETGQRQNEPPTEDVAYIPQRQRRSWSAPGSAAAPSGNTRTTPPAPTGRTGRCPPAPATPSERFPQIEVGLQQPGAPAAPQPGLRGGDDPADPRRRHRHGEHLAGLDDRQRQQDRHGRPLAHRRHRAADPSGVPVGSGRHKFPR